jgi:hypothetical protein
MVRINITRGYIILLVRIYPVNPTIEDEGCFTIILCKHAIKTSAAESIHVCSYCYMLCDYAVPIPRINM